MGRSPCCDKDSGLKKGPWTPEEDEKLTSYIQKHGCGSWRALPKSAGLNRCGKSCRLRWTNYLRPDIKRGKFTDEEEALIIKFHSVLGNKWSRIATHLPGRTDNEIKNFWNTHIRKKLLQMGIDPTTHKPRTDLNILTSLSHLLSTQNMMMMNHNTAGTGGLIMNQQLQPNVPPNWDCNNMSALKLQSDATQLAKLQVLNNIFQILNTNNSIPTATSNCSNSSGHLINPPPSLLDQNTTASQQQQLQLGGGSHGGAGASSNTLTTALQDATSSFDLAHELSNYAATNAYPWGITSGTHDHQTLLATTHNDVQANYGSNNHNDQQQMRVPTENILPGLVTFSPKPDYSSYQAEMMSKSNTNSANYGSSDCTDQSPGDDFFEGLDKLIDDDATCDSFWKEFIKN